MDSTRSGDRMRAWLPAILALAVLAAFALRWRRSHAPAPRARAELGLAARQPRAAAAAPAVVPGAPVVGAPRWHPREPAEWQGMLVNAAAVPPCESSAGCGLARACVQGTCVACARDSDCAAGEACAMDHCVVQATMACRGRADCASGQLCVLSGYSSLARGNEGMRAYCLDPESGDGTRPPFPEAAPDPRTELPDDDLIKRARAAASQPPA